MYKTILFLSGVVLFITSCSGDNSKESTSNIKTEVKKVLKGVFFDSVVSGAKYKTPTISGVTDSKGIFKFKEGEEVEFFINNISLGKAKPQPKPTSLSKKIDTDSVITPLILAKNDTNKAIKIAQFLISTDKDKNPNNGIDIDISKLTVDLNKSLNIDTLDLNKSVKNLVSKSEAENHLKISLGIKISKQEDNSDINKTKESRDKNRSNIDKVDNKNSNQDNTKNIKNDINSTKEDMNDSKHNSKNNISEQNSTNSDKDETNNTKDIENNRSNNTNETSDQNSTNSSVSDLNNTNNKEDNSSTNIDNNTVNENNSSEQNSTNNKNQQNNLQIPKKYNKRVLNNSKEEVTGKIDIYTIKIYTNSQVDINEQTPHKGVVVKFNGKQSETLSISNSYINKNILIVLVDDNNKIVAISDEIKVEDIPVIVVNLK